MPVRVSVRFDVFKRDNFSCQYCGRCSPDVVLEVDHIVPACEGGDDDAMNLRTACWECNRGKSGTPLEHVVTGDDPHARAIALLEQERQLKEYNVVLAKARERRESDAWDLLQYWTDDPDLARYDTREFSWVVNTLAWLPAETIREFMDAAMRRGFVRDLRYVKGCVRNLREASQATLHG